MTQPIKSLVKKALQHVLENPIGWERRNSDVNVFLEINGGDSISQEGLLEISLDNYNGLSYIIDNVKIEYSYDGCDVDSYDTTIDWTKVNISVTDKRVRPWIEYVDENIEYDISDLVDTDSWISEFCNGSNFGETIDDYYTDNWPTEADYID